MLEQLLRELRNWFQVKIVPGTYTIQNGGIALPFSRTVSISAYAEVCSTTDCTNMDHQ